MGGGCTGVPMGVATVGWGVGGGNRAVGGNSGGGQQWGGWGLQPLRTAVHTISIRLQNCLS